jgi:hypothetical protein
MDKDVRKGVRKADRDVLLARTARFCLKVLKEKKSNSDKNLKSKSGSESKLCYYRRSVGQSVLVSSTHLGPKTRFLLLSVPGFVDLGRLL